MRRCRSINLAMNKLARAESTFLSSEFLAPVVCGGRVTVQIAGVRCAMAIEPRDFRGWGVFQPLSPADARLERNASQGERRRYLELFPPVRLIVFARTDGFALATSANVTADVVRVQLAEDVELFDTIVARFDGGQYWFDAVDARADPAAAAYLRERSLANVEPRQLDRPGLTAGQRHAYGIVYEHREAVRRAAEQRQGELRLRRALTHAGAEMRDFSETVDGFRVTYTVDGQRHVSVVDNRDLTVHSAGICLRGEDRKFDLASLVGVLRGGSTYWNERRR
jgi:hypothetical protein